MTDYEEAWVQQYLCEMRCPGDHACVLGMAGHPHIFPWMLHTVGQDPWFALIILQMAFRGRRMLRWMASYLRRPGAVLVSS